MTNYITILSKSWDNMMRSEYLFKSNTMRRIIEITGEEMGSPYSKKSDIIIFYNIQTGNPMVMVERILVDTLITMPVEYEFSIPGFTVNIEHIKKDDDAYIEIIITAQDLYTALSK